MLGWYEEFIYPRPFTSIFEAIVKADDQVSDGTIRVRHQVNEPVRRVLKKFGQIIPNARFVERLGPGLSSCMCCINLKIESRSVRLASFASCNISGPLIVILMHF